VLKLLNYCSFLLGDQSTWKILITLALFQAWGIRGTTT